MASSITAPDFRTRYYLRIDLSSLDSRAEAETDFDPLLNALTAQSRSDAQAIYRFDPSAREFKAVAVRSTAQPLIRNAGVTLTAAASAWLFGLSEPAQGNAATDERFERFPERLQFGVETILAVPFRNGEKLLGFLTLSRRERGNFDAETIQLAKRTARLIGAVIERHDLNQNELQQVLRERKYVYLRNTSGLRWVPMARAAR